MNVWLAAAVPIEEKIKNAPNAEYTVGVLIGSFLPLILLGLVAWGLYAYFKKKDTQP